MSKDDDSEKRSEHVDDSGTRDEGRSIWFYIGWSIAGVGLLGVLLVWLAIDKQSSRKSLRTSNQFTHIEKPTRNSAPNSKRSQQTNTEEYEDYGVNEMIRTREDAKSTFAVDVDTGSYTIARRKLRDGKMPPPESVRVEEFVNYFDYDYPQPESGPFTADLEAAPSPFSTQSERHLLRVGVQGKHLTRKTRKPAHLVFLVDVSGSMDSPDKLGLVKRSLRILTQNLGEGDSIALATYAGAVETLLEPTNVSRHKHEVLSAIERLESDGSTAMGSGIERAYDLAERRLAPDHVNRVIVLSDGDANVGPQVHGEILDQIEKRVEAGIRVSTIGVGMGNYKDVMMEQLANKGDGNYYYLDTIEEARRLFGPKLDGLLQVIARDVKIQVAFNPETVPRYRLIGYENRNIQDENFRDETVDAGEIGAGHTVTALYEIDVASAAEGRLATTRIRHQPPGGGEVREVTFELSRSDLHDQLQEASREFQFAAAVAGFAELLRDSPYARDISYDLVHELGRAAAGDDERRHECLDMIERADELDE